MGYAYKLGGKIWIDSQRSLARGIYCWPVNAAEKNNELQGMERLNLYFLSYCFLNDTSTRQ